MKTVGIVASVVAVGIIGNSIYRSLREGCLYSFGTKAIKEAQANTQPPKLSQQQAK
jgi:hypothetical protein